MASVFAVFVRISPNLTKLAAYDTGLLYRLLRLMHTNQPICLDKSLSIWYYRIIRAG